MLSIQYRRPVKLKYNISNYLLWLLDIKSVITKDNYNMSMRLISTEEKDIYFKLLSYLRPLKVGVSKTVLCVHRQIYDRASSSTVVRMK